MYHGENLAELREAARGLEMSIESAKSAISPYNSEGYNPYMNMYPGGQLVLAPMLAAQITILQQIDKLTGTKYRSTSVGY